MNIFNLGSQFSSQESSIRSSPIIGFETAGSATYDSSIRYRTSAQGSGYQDKIKGQQSFGAPVSLSVYIYIKQKLLNINLLTLISNK